MKFLLISDMHEHEEFSHKLLTKHIADIDAILLCGDVLNEVCSEIDIPENMQR